MGDDEDFEQLLSGLADALAEPVSQPSVHVPEALDVAVIRRKTGLSQPAFASRIGIPVGTLRNWEQGHRSPQGPARVLLALLDRNPRIVEETLAD